MGGNPWLDVPLEDYVGHMSSPAIAQAQMLAALFKENRRMAGKNTAVILSGGNIERRRFLQVLRGETPGQVSGTGI